MQQERETYMGQILNSAFTLFDVANLGGGLTIQKKS